MNEIYVQQCKSVRYQEKLKTTVKVRITDYLQLFI